MKLSLEQIKNVTIGAHNIFEEDGKFYFERFTKKQFQAYSDNGLMKSAPATEGIVFDFHSNTKKLTFRAVGLNYRYEVLLDNQSIFYTTLPEEEYTISLDFDGKEHRITLLLPSHSKGVLEYIEIDDGATLVPHKYDYKFLFWGDSITQGWHSKYDSNGYTHRVSRHFNAESVMLGVGSSRFIADCIDKEHYFDPEVVFVAYGTNDWGKFPAIETTMQHCRDFVKKIKEVYPNKIYIGITPTFRNDKRLIKAGLGYREFTKMLLSVYNTNGFIAVNGSDLVPHDKSLLTDPVHLTDEGFRYYAENLIPIIEEALKNK